MSKYNKKIMCANKKNAYEIIKNSTSDFKNLYKTKVTELKDGWAIYLYKKKVIT